MGRGDSPITIPWQGGLGNQLFQLAAGIAVSQRLGRPVRWTDYWLTHPDPEETARSFALQGLLRDEELVSLYTPRHGRVTDRFGHRRVIERAADDDALARVGGWTRSVVGYFQRLDYVQEAWPELRRRFERSPSSAHRQLLQPVDTTVGAIHYRLGDYVTNKHANTMHGVTSPEYFAAIMRDKARTADITHWVVVSDDPDSAITMLRSSDLPDDVRATTPGSGDEWSDLRLLSSASVCAISNSSFSWWAAFIGSATHGAKVVAPLPWFDEARGPSPALFLRDWEVRERSVLKSVNRPDE